MMNYIDAMKAAVKICFAKYAEFNGRAKRPEFWWFALFCFVISLFLEFVNTEISWIFSLFTLVPSLAAGARRLHDINKSGWMQLIWIIPVLGWIYMIFLLAQPSDADDNQYVTP